MNQEWGSSRIAGIRLGINPITWSNDDLPELGGDTPLERCLSEAKEAGYEGVELGNKFPRDPAKLTPILRAHGLDLVSGWYSARLLQRSVEDEIAALEPHLRLLEALGSRVLVFAEVTGAVHTDRSQGLSRRPRLSPKEAQHLASGIQEVGRHTKRRGVRLAYHHHMGTVIESEEDIDRLMAATNGAVGLLFDSGHLAYSGAHPLRVLERHADRIAHVHLKDVRRDVLKVARSDDRPFLDAVLDGVFTVPGDGSLDFPAMIGALKRGGYKGWMVVEAEQDPAKAHPLTYAKLGHDHIERLIRA
jgi:inosose dehydratase